MNHEHRARRMKRVKRAVVAAIVLVTLSLFVSLIIVWPSFSLQRRPFSAPEASYHSWDEILLHPQPVTIRTYSTGMMQTPLSAIMNLEHELAQGIEDEPIAFPVTVNILQHQQLGAYLIDAGLDASYVHSPYGTQTGFMVKSKSGLGSQEPDTHIAAILNRENIQIQGVFLTHLHPDHTAGILDLPKDIPYVAGQDEFYINFRFFMHTDHLAGVDGLHEIDFATGVDLPPLGKGVDLFGDGSLWAISSGGHSKGHVIYFINGVEDRVLVTGDACNTQYQFDSGIGPGTYSSDLEQAQATLDRIIAFKQQYPEVRLVYGHDLDNQD